MSHSISLTCPHCRSTTFDSSVTTNLTPMLKEASGFYFGDEKWEGQPGVVMLPKLQETIDTLEGDPARWKEFNPENGWGDYYGLVVTLKRLRDAIARQPEAIYHDYH